MLPCAGRGTFGRSQIAESVLALSCRYHCRVAHGRTRYVRSWLAVAEIYHLSMISPASVSDSFGVRSSMS